jgi:hypothetical protein
MKIGGVSAGWTEALLLAKETHRNKLKKDIPGPLSGILARFKAIGSVILHKFGKDNVLNHMSSRPGVALGGLRNRIGNAAQNFTGGDGLGGALKTIKHGVQDAKNRAGRELRELMGQETADDQLAEMKDDIKKGLNELTGGWDNIKNGFRNLSKFILD